MQKKKKRLRLPIEHAKQMAVVLLVCLLKLNIDTPVVGPVIYLSCLPCLNIVQTGKILLCPLLIVSAKRFTAGTSR